MIFIVDLKRDLIQGVVHILCTPKITFFESRCCTAYILSTPMRTYKVALPPPQYKIVMPYQILVSEFQVYVQPLVKSSGVISVCAPRLAFSASCD